MNESELIEEFNRELDSVLQGGPAAPFSPDPGAMELASCIARADFSEESLIKESLRDRLAAEPAGFLVSLRSLFANNSVRAAMAAAVLVITLLPLARRHTGCVPETQAPVMAALPQVPSPLLPVRARVSRLPAALAASGAAGEELFAAVPMGRLETEPIKAFPIASAGSGSPIVLAAGREVKLENGSGIVLETEGAVFTLERRVIAPEDIFERRVI